MREGLGAGGFCLGELREVTKLAELFAERFMEHRAMRGVQRSVPKAVVGTFKGDHARFIGGEQGGLQCGLHGFKTGVAKNGFRMARRHLVR